jgi:signal peptidase
LHRQHILTKGDNNQIDDVSLYPDGQTHVKRTQIVGVVKGYLPTMGVVSLELKERKWLAVVLAAVLALIGCYY